MLDGSKWWVFFFWMQNFKAMWHTSMNYAFYIKLYFASENLKFVELFDDFSSPTSTLSFRAIFLCFSFGAEMGLWSIDLETIFKSSFVLWRHHSFSPQIAFPFLYIRTLTCLKLVVHHKTDFRNLIKYLNYVALLMQLKFSYLRVIQYLWIKFLKRSRLGSMSRLLGRYNGPDCSQ